jgi:hypothetical protein
VLLLHQRQFLQHQRLAGRLADAYNKCVSSRNLIGALLKLLKTKNRYYSFESLGRLIQIMRHDEIINKNITVLLQLDLYQRRLVLNEWLEQLRIQNAPQNLLNALSSLFDDKVAEQVMELINEV